MHYGQEAGWNLANKNMRRRLEFIKTNISFTISGVSTLSGNGCPFENSYTE